MPRVTIDTELVLFGADTDFPKTVTCVSGGTLTYGSLSSTTGVFTSEGTLTVGASVDLTKSKWFKSASSSVVVDTLTPQADSAESSGALFDDAVSPLLTLSDTTIPGQATTVLGMLGEDLYIFGTADADTDLKGVRRVKASTPDTVDVLTTAVVVGTHQFSGTKVWPGAVNFKDKLYVGSGGIGRMTRLDLNGDGSFNALTLMELAAGGEDVHPGPVLWGYLYLLTYGANDSDGPAVYKWDGVAGTATLVKKFTTHGDGGLVTSASVVDGQLFVTVFGGELNPTGYSLWAIDRDGTATELDSSTSIWYEATEWCGELVGIRSDSVQPLKGWKDGAWVNISAGNSPTNGSIFPMGDELFALDYYTGVWRYRHGDWDQLWNGTYAGTPSYGFYQPVVWGENLVFTSTQGTQTVWKLPLGATRSLRALRAPQKQLGLRSVGGGGDTTALEARLSKRAWAPDGGIENYTRVGERLGESVGMQSGRLQIHGGLVLPAGEPVTNISFLAGTGAVTPTHQFAALIDQSYNILAKSTDLTTDAWPDGEPQTFPLSAPYTPSVDTPVYLAAAVVAGTAPTLQSINISATADALDPLLSANASYDMTTPASLTVVDNVEVLNQLAWGYVT